MTYLEEKLDTNVSSPLRTFSLCGLRSWKVDQDEYGRKRKKETGTQDNVSCRLSTCLGKRQIRKYVYLAWADGTVQIFNGPS